MASNRHTPAQFKEKWKVGDVIAGYHRMILRITAVGEGRFLAINGHGREAVNTMNNATAKWLEPDPADRDDFIVAMKARGLWK